MSFQLEFTKEIEKNTAGIYQKIKSVVPEVEWPLHAPYIYKINELKNRGYRDAIVDLNFKCFFHIVFGLGFKDRA